MTPQAITFASSPFWPIAIGFFGLGNRLLHLGWASSSWHPKAGPEVDRDHGYVGVLDARFLPVPHGRISDVGLTWFGVFANAAPLYMAGVAFTVYGIHWFAMAHRRYVGSSAGTRRMDGDRIFLHFGARNLRVWQGRRRSGHDYLHRSHVDLSRGSTHAAGGLERRLPNRCAASNV